MGAGPTAGAHNPSLVERPSDRPTALRRLVGALAVFSHLLPTSSCNSYQYSRAEYFGPYAPDIGYPRELLGECDRPFFLLSRQDPTVSAFRVLLESAWDGYVLVTAIGTRSPNEITVRETSRANRKPDSSRMAVDPTIMQKLIECWNAVSWPDREGGRVLLVDSSCADCSSLLVERVANGQYHAQRVVLGSEDDGTRQLRACTKEALDASRVALPGWLPTWF